MLRSCYPVIFSGKLTQILPTQYQVLRWKRKPRKPFWLGTAKSKMFRVHDQPVLPSEEKLELLRLHANYKSAMKSIRGYFNSKESEEADLFDMKATHASAEEIEESLRRNEAWNAACARIREERLALQDKKHEEDVLKVIERRDAKKTALQQRIDELVRMEKENSKEFITPENIDAKVEECIDTLTDYNYAIDLKGSIYTGFESEMKANAQVNSVTTKETQQNAA